MIGVIADDLTGAAELGAIGWRHGLRAEIVRSGKPSGAADIVCVDTDSRSCEPAEAAKRAAAAAKLLCAAGAKWIYKKVDSVLRGQVTAETEAVMRQLKLKRALLLPANPSLGRTIKDGEYFLRGKPLHKTEFANDPHFPRRSSSVLRLVKAPEIFAMRTADGERALADGMIVFGDAESAADLQRWTEGCDAQMLPVGGAEFFNALLEQKIIATGKKHPRTVSGSLAPSDGERAGERGFDSANKVPPLPSPLLHPMEERESKRSGLVKTPPQKKNTPLDEVFFGGKEFFIVGTSTLAARKFVAAERRKKTPVFSLPQELAWVATFSAAAVEAVTQRVAAGLENSPRVILNVGLPQVRDADVAGRLSDHVVRVAEKVLRRSKVSRVFAEGGATAAELVRRMDWSRLAVVRELAPGVATLAVEGDEIFLLTIKPGSYSWPTELD